MDYEGKSLLEQTTDPQNAINTADIIILRREDKSYSWLLKYLKPNDNIILPGGSGNYTAGNSSLAAHLPEDGFK